MLQLEIDGFNVGGYEMHLISKNPFALFLLRGDRCGKIPVEVDVGKISSGFSMNINEFSQLATSHLCENVCLLNKLNTFFPRLPFEFEIPCLQKKFLFVSGPINISLKARGHICTLHHISLNRTINISLKAMGYICTLHHISLNNKYFNHMDFS